jgi:hypothetical protein
MRTSLAKQRVLHKVIAWARRRNDAWLFHNEAIIARSLWFVNRKIVTSVTRLWLAPTQSKCRMLQRL